ncbi:Uncharacterized protein dnm_071810 [Desulfonema magnum]|uniref:Uncharacterized protein n=1 Tax=Desulfonema magnum TaxID=45655 RepID=A0A975BT00_9BACT|nr:Uncharacterized protein dnm_071810 [Desulfonema magnum]
MTNPGHFRRICQSPGSGSGHFPSTDYIPASLSPKNSGKHISVVMADVNCQALSDNEFILYQFPFN